MWRYRLTAPGHVERADVPDDDSALAAGEVRLRVLVAGMCGSDMPRFLGTFGQFGGAFDCGDAPIHEVVGEVVESASARFTAGTRVVGTLDPTAGLAEYVTTDETRLIAVPSELDDVEAIVIQPLSTILRAANEQLPAVTGSRVAVIGAGPCGLGFCHVLRSRGAEHIVAIDPVERAATALAFGADEFVNAISSAWLRDLAPAPRPHLVVEAVGHQQQTIADAINAVADRGFVFGFGAPDDEVYAFPYGEVYLRDLTVASGRTLGAWPDLLNPAAAYLLEHRQDFAAYVSHVVPIADAQHAYELYARPQQGRLKVAITAT